MKVYFNGIKWFKAFLPRSARKPKAFDAYLARNSCSGLGTFNGTIGRKKPPFSFNGTYVKWDLPTGNLTYSFIWLLYILFMQSGPFSLMIYQWDLVVMFHMSYPCWSVSRWAGRQFVDPQDPRMPQKELEISHL